MKIHNVKLTICFSVLAFAIAALSACRGSDAGSASGVVSPPPTPTLSAFVGNTNGAGNADGVGMDSAFNTPFGIAADSAGNLFVADTINHTIRKITPSGVVTTFAGTVGIAGVTDATGTAALFRNPLALTVDSSDNLLIADTYNHTVREITPAGVVTTLAGTGNSSGSTDGTGSAARFNTPEGIAVDSSGNVFVSDTNNHTIRKIDTDGVVTTFAGSAGASGTTDATGSAARFNRPSSLVVDASDNLYVTDTGNHTVRKITPAAEVTTIAGTAGVDGSTDATGTAASFYSPHGLTIDSSGNLYVTDTYNRTIRKIDTSNVVTTIAGSAGLSGSTDANGSSARFQLPFGITINGTTGVLYIADTYNHGIRCLATNGDVTTLAGGPSLTGTTDATGTAARFNSPRHLATDTSGNVYVVDLNNHTLRKITPEGVVTTFAGTAGANGSADGTGIAASFYQPFGITSDSSDNLYVTDSANHTIRQITSAGVVTTLAGSAGFTGSTDGIGTAARFTTPSGITTDNLGNLYITDRNNQTIRKLVIATGEVTTLAGSVGSTGSSDGTGAAARFTTPYAIAYDASTGNMYVADYSNHLIRTITPAGVVSTLAGTAGSAGSADGTGTVATFRFPTAIVSDGVGNLYVGDTNNFTVRKIVISTGAVTTVIGQAGNLGFSGGTLPGSLAYTRGLAVFDGKMYISTNYGIVSAVGY